MNQTEKELAKSETSKLADKYSDIVFDLIASITPAAQTRVELFQTWIRKMTKQSARFTKYERAAAIKVSTDLLLAIDRTQINNKKQFDPRSRLNIDIDTNRTRHFEYFFNHLRTFERLLLLLSDKYDFSYNEIGTILGMPEDSVRLNLLMIYESLEYNIWRPGE
ncbi:MAG: sigma-70 family RNA polymerase sigma factor [Xanthomonadaceae bacterium]|nr:sigma-70 family RNA polymerase sigma factor [Xanthomonadaceae bacterium]